MAQLGNPLVLELEVKSHIVKNFMKLKTAQIEQLIGHVDRLDASLEGVETPQLDRVEEIRAEFSDIKGRISKLRKGLEFSE